MSKFMWLLAAFKLSPTCCPMALFIGSVQHGSLLLQSQKGKTSHKTGFVTICNVNHAHNHMHSTTFATFYKVDERAALAHTQG